ncbi:von Willebrand factor-like [Varanus komodoensis]|uniref:von Willebrand factor-like n=1 Tax=Varanus komodoensis TaxID=61221 RepID=UPI001CF797D9|nr:von Willebrand factor-like [Varanus komodoensis]
MFSRETDAANSVKLAFLNTHLGDVLAGRTCEGKIANIDNTCCKKCIEPECKQVTGRLEYVKVDDCVNENQLNIHYCEGKCESKAVYNITTNQIEDECTCCSATIIDSMKVPLRCVNGSIVHQEVLNARQCDCFSRKCKPQI